MCLDILWYDDNSFYICLIFTSQIMFSFLTSTHVVLLSIDITLTLFIGSQLDQSEKYSDSKEHGAHLGPGGPRWAPHWPHESCYQGLFPWNFYANSLSSQQCCMLTGSQWGSPGCHIQLVGWYLTAPDPQQLGNCSPPADYVAPDWLPGLSWGIRGGEEGWKSSGVSIAICYWSIDFWYDWNTAWLHDPASHYADSRFWKSLLTICPMWQ